MKQISIIYGIIAIILVVIVIFFIRQLFKNSKKNGNKNSNKTKFQESIKVIDLLIKLKLDSKTEVGILPKAVVACKLL